MGPERAETNDRVAPTVSVRARQNALVRAEDRSPDVPSAVLTGLDARNAVAPNAVVLNAVVPNEVVLNEVVLNAVARGAVPEVARGDPATHNDATVPAGLTLSPRIAMPLWPR